MNRRIAGLEQKITGLQHQLDILEQKGELANEVDKANMRSLLREVREELRVWITARNSLLRAAGTPIPPTASNTPVYELADGNYQVDSGISLECARGNPLGQIQGKISALEIAEQTKVRVLFSHYRNFDTSVDTTDFSQVYLTDDLGRKYSLVKFDQTHITSKKIDLPVHYIDPPRPPQSLEVPSNWKRRKKWFTITPEYIGVEKSPQETVKYAASVMNQIDPLISIWITADAATGQYVLVFAKGGRKMEIKAITADLGQTFDDSESIWNDFSRRRLELQNKRGEEFREALKKVAESLEPPKKVEAQSYQWIGIPLHKGENVYVNFTFPRVDPRAKNFQVYLPLCGIIFFRPVGRAIAQ